MFPCSFVQCKGQNNQIVEGVKVFNLKTVVSRMTVKVWCEQIEQMTSKPKLCIPGINLHEKWSFLTNLGHFLWSSLRYDYLLLISNQNDVERCAIPVAYLYTSHKGQKHRFHMDLGQNDSVCTFQYIYSSFLDFFTGFLLNRVC